MSPVTLEDWESEFSDMEDEESSVIHNKSLVHYTTLLPDYSNVSFGDSDSVTENSVITDKFSVQSAVSPSSRLNSSNSSITCNGCDYIELNTNELRIDRESCPLTQELNVALLKIKKLEDKQDEMLQLHASMTALVSNLVEVVSTCISGQTVHRSPQSSPLQPVNKGISFQPPSSKPLKAAIKEEIPSDFAEERKEDIFTKERMKQRQFIHTMVSYIDERATFYNRNKSIPIQQHYPKVDWARINIHTKRNLPQPSQLPVHGCPQDPLIYPDAPKPEGRIMEHYKATSKCSIPGCEHKHCIPPPGCITTTHPNSCKDGSFTAISQNEEREVLLTQVYHPLSTTSSPFGRAPGFPTNLGVVAMPTCPVGGYIFMEGEGWVLHATPG